MVADLVNLTPRLLQKYANEKSDNCFHLFTCIQPQALEPHKSPPIDCKYSH